MADPEQQLMAVREEAVTPDLADVVFDRGIYPSGQFTVLYSRLGGGGGSLVFTLSVSIDKSSVHWHELDTVALGNLGGATLRSYENSFRYARVTTVANLDALEIEIASSSN